MRQVYHIKAEVVDIAQNALFGVVERFAIFEPSLRALYEPSAFVQNITQFRRELEDDILFSLGLTPLPTDTPPAYKCMCTLTLLKTYDGPSVPELGEDIEKKINDLEKESI